MFLTASPAGNECEEGTDNCSDNAECTDTPQGFDCECNTGYSGDGVTCDGRYIQLHIN